MEFLQALINFIITNSFDFFKVVIISFIVFYLKSLYNTYTIKKRFALSLSTEITLLMKQYRHKRREGPPFKLVEITDPEGNTVYKRGKILLSESFLTVYDHNTDKLGLLSEDTIREVITMYSMARGHIYSVNTWNNELTTETEFEREEVRRYEKVLEEEYRQLTCQEKIVIKCLKNEQSVLIKICQKLY